MTGRELLDDPEFLERIRREYALQDAMDRSQWPRGDAPDTPKRRAHAARLALRELVDEREAGLNVAAAIGQLADITGTPRDLFRA